MRERGEYKKEGESRHGREEPIIWSEVEPGLDGASKGSKRGALGDGGGGGIPELAQAWESCARSAFPRTWKAGHGHRALSTSVGVRNVFASSSACRRSLSPSHSTRHLNIHMRAMDSEKRGGYVRCDLVDEPADFEGSPEKDLRRGGSISGSGGHPISCPVTCKE
jgi:hypothetical protein